jgi:hypothetical protein
MKLLRERSCSCMAKFCCHTKNRSPYFFPSKLARAMDQNYLCANDITTVACQSLFFGPGPADTYGAAHSTIRTPCKTLPWTCMGLQPARDAPCISPGVWLVIGSLSVTPQQPVITGNVTIQGNLTIPTGSTLTVQIGSVVTVQGCLNLDGTLRIDVSTRPNIQTGEVVTLIEFGSNQTSLCSPNTTTTGAVRVVGAPACTSVRATESVSSRSLTVLLEVAAVDNCAPSAQTGQPSLNVAALAGGIAAGVFVLLAITFIILYKCRARIIPSLKLNSKLRQLHTR